MCMVLMSGIMLMNIEFLQCWYFSHYKARKAVGTQYYFSQSSLETLFPFFLTVPWFSLTWFTVKQTIKITVKYADRVRLYPSSQIPLQTERYVHSKVDKTEVLHRFSPTFLRFSSTGFRRTLAPARWEVKIDLRVVRGWSHEHNRCQIAFRTY